MMTIKYLLASLICLFYLSSPVFTQKLLVDSSFTPTLDGSVNFIEILSGGKILIAGNFTSVNGVTRNKIARLNPDGSLDPSFNANSVIVVQEFLNPVINSMEVLPDGKILLGGDFGSAQPLEYRKTVLRLNADGTFDSTLTSFPRILSGVVGGYNIQVRKAEQLPNGKILICGNFLVANGNQQPKLARYNFDGSFDPTFTTTISHETAVINECRDVEAQTDGKYLVSGIYTNVNGAPRAGLTRFNADDTIDTTFNVPAVPNTTTSYYSGIELLSDGTMIVAQYPQNQNSFVLPRAVRLNTDGSLIELYDETETSTSDYLRDVKDVAVQANGKVYIVDGAREHFYRYHTDGTRDASQNRIWMHSNDFVNGGLKAVAVQPDGKVIVGGNFREIYPEFGSSNNSVNQKFLARFTPQAIPIKPKFDFDGDGKDDMAVFRPGDRFWYLNRSTAGFYATQFGLSQDKPVVADYDGDGKADIAVWRNGVWYWLRSSDSVFATGTSGQAGDIPIPGNYKGNGSLNGLLVFRPSEGKFYVRQPFQNPSLVSVYGFEFMPNDKPVVADYDGDGKNDLAVFRDGHWFYETSSRYSTVRHFSFGLATDKPVIGDFDGDLRNDYAVFRPSNGTWYIQKSTEGFYAVKWGLADDLPVPADYDGDGKTDIAVYRNGVWYQLRSTNSNHFEQFGLSNDIPVQLR
jgi:uncharacterized delta-60 repeat protein